MVVTALCRSAMVNAACRTITDTNADCVVGDVVVPENCNFELSVYEDCPVESKLLTFEESGFDVGCSQFQLIDSNSVGLKSELDTESRSEIDCPQFMTEDGINDVYVVVTVVNVNEFDPIIDIGTTYTVEIDENNAIDDTLLTFNVTDQDSGEIASLTATPQFDTTKFALTQGACTTTSCPFTLTVLEVLDYESGMFYQLDTEFTTSDTRGDTSTVFQTVLVFVQDQPDSPPFWLDTEPSATVEESDVPVPDIFTVQARDRDISINNDIKYEIIDGNDEGLFSIDPDSGKVSTTAGIDREALISAFFNLVIQATEVLQDGTVAPPPNNVTQVTIIQILDVNDNSPTFSETEVTMDIDEMTDANSPGGSVTITLQDLDEGDAGTYTIETDDPDHLTVSPDTGSGNVTITLKTVYEESDNIFDYDIPDGIHEIIFTVTATELADSSHKNDLKVTVTISDVNDNTPEFSEPDGYAGSIKEGTVEGEAVLTVSATDLDMSDAFGTESIRYSLLDCESDLAIDAISGAVTTARAPDYEQAPELLCRAQAHDEQGNGRVAETSVIVTIEDVNDEPPVLSAQPTAEVSEDTAVGSVVLRVTASDPDTTADVDFELEAKDGDDTIKGWFTITVVDCDGEGVGFCGDITVANTLDREMLMSPYTVLVAVRATDQNSETGQQIDEADVTITILDVNDVAPVFCSDCTEGLSVVESAQDGSAIAYITAFDPDEDDQGALIFSCRANEKVDINATTGLLFVLDGDAIDRETEDTVTVTLTVTDTADHFNTVEVTLAVIDINDNDPELDQALCNAPYVVMEDETTGYTVVQLNATDPDLGVHGEQTYVLQNNILSSGTNPITPFAVSPSGLVTVYENETLGKMLDRETFETWALSIRVYDGCEDGEFTCTSRMGECEITVAVGDVNDMVPGLLRPLTLFAGEELVMGSVVPDSDITAFDGDLVNTTATEIHYKVVGFQDDEGTDIEEIPFEAEDFSTLTAQLLMEWSCRLITTKNLTHMTGSYILQVNATDGTEEEPGNTNTLSVTMEITDYNDNNPVIVMGGCLAQYGRIVTISEDTYKAGSFIPCDDDLTDPATLSYTDDDTDEPNNLAIISIDYDNSVVEPSDLSPGQRESFELVQNGETFELFLKQDMIGNLSLEQGKSYNLSIVATDKGNPPLSSTKDWIFVNLTSKSEFNPAFCENIDDCVATSYITENTQNFGPFPAATDADNVGDYIFDIIYYYVIYDTSGCFDIPDSTKLVNQLTPQCELDRESVQYYTVLVQATNSMVHPPMVNSGDPVSTDMLQVTVVIMDVNDNPPNFGSSVIYGSVVQTGSVGQDAALLEALDLDLNETLTYEFAGDFQWNPSGGYGADVFEIINDDVVGTVTLAVSPSSLKGNCIVPVIVYDKSETGEHNDTAVLQIFVVEATDQVPFYFENDIETLSDDEENIEFILSSLFRYEAFIDSMNPTVGTDNTTLDSVLAVHFVNSSASQRNIDAPGNLVARSVITSLASSGRLSTELQQELEQLGLHLYRIGDSEVTASQDLEQQLLTYQIVLGVVAMLLGSLVFLLLAAYIVRTRKLERRVKVLSTNTFGSKASDLDKTGLGLQMDVIPNSNMFKGEGANPMFNTSFKEYDRQDSGSMSSGDSVLVGVEDNPEFRDYTGGDRPSLINTKDDTFGKTGGMVSSNPLFSNMGKKSEGGDSDSNVDAAATSDDAQSQEAGDLGVTNSNFSFL